MEKKSLKIDNIPLILWGEKSKKIIIAVHGNKSNKEDLVIKLLATQACNKDYQVLSFDLPGHGDRINDTNYICNIQNCVKDIRKVYQYALNNFEIIDVWACSMGAYFSMVALSDATLRNCYFLSPVVDMLSVIESLMKYANVTKEMLKEKKVIETNFGETLYYDYYEYVLKNRIEKWENNTHILYGENDNVQSYEIIKNFSEKYSCDIFYARNCNHYFASQNEIENYINWLNLVIS